MKLTRRQRQLARWLAAGARICEFDDGDCFVGHEPSSGPRLQQDIKLSTLRALQSAGLVRAVDGAWVANTRCMREYS